MAEMTKKHEFHPQADEKNMMGERRGKPALLCGARRKGVDARCRQYAGMGTEHSGYGRCKYCGGNNTGPKTEEGKQRVSQNSRIHGLYASTLNDAGQEIYEQLTQDNRLGLEHEIYVLKTQIIQHLRSWKDKTERRMVAVEGTLNAYEWYLPGTIDDRAYVRALEALGRLVEKHARLNQDSGEDLLSQVNKELAAASQGKVQISWGGKPQQRLDHQPAK
ncbi:hypothetical protein BG53_09070 [Paenibacillus darwinianus]|uniref:Uncharacterized protein n=1 Tax=Paenibacillus darwinianus TaxID=1380763 RepID=A0A9W5W6J1_9BACL|nr:hypothetical protein [Paenibacillus darwinianus]EXX84608.1 hypothetical protein CH50_11395 [Paenibacillus darwinianus]EXX85183.1 hypothetical protein BG52_08990 [Paenibacillus darwinianus]EXX85243.1 hypothetical protein BG53_09070 [Paenibacillus darwinianus]